MKKFSSNWFNVLMMAAMVMASPLLWANAFSEAITDGKAYGDLRLRFETVEQDNPLDDADAFTLRTRLGYTTADLTGFSATLEMEDSRIVGGVGDYSVPPTGFKTGQYSVIADPEHTELDQGFVQYKQGMVTAKLGRQVLTYDGHRFVGHVGWRQDRQTYDGFSLSVLPFDDLTMNYAYLSQRNRIFAEVADVDSNDHLLNIAYTTSVGKLVGYAYLLENDFGTNDDTNNTFGLSFSGGVGEDVKLLYALEFASQTAEVGVDEYDATYLLLEGGVGAAGITAKLGYEVLGSDDGTYGFATPLATLHKFNGWADLFLATPATGLVDAYFSLGGSLSGGKWAVAYHSFSADEDLPGMEDYGDEIDISYSRGFAENFNAGIKYAAYSADDFAVDSDKLWVWVGLSF